jgi:glutamate-1-semialdehyde 2,1-aminomutase
MSSTARHNAVDIAHALREEKCAYVERNPTSALLHKQAASIMPGGNTRTILFYDPFPLVMVRGEGGHVWDADGHEYVDLLGEYTAALYGHSHPLIRAAIDEALNGGINLGAHNRVEAQLARAIGDRIPSMELIRFTNSGTEANLMALTLARAATGRRKILVFEGAYHGAVLSFANSNDPRVNAPYDFVVREYNDTTAATATIQEHAADLAAVLIEPMLGAGGCIPGDPSFLLTLRRETERCGALLIFDEVMTSRLSPGGLQQALGITPDLTTLGKYLGGGMSFGAFGGSARLMERFDPRRPDALPHAGTFNNNVLSMHAGLAGLTKVYTPNAATALNRTGTKLRDQLNSVCDKQRAKLQFTGCGSLMTAHFRVGQIQSASDAMSADQVMKELFFFHLLARGIYVARRAMIILSLPTTAADRQALVDAVASFIDAYASVLTASGESAS